MFNKYLNTSGKATIIIKAASTAVIAGKNYVQGQVITTMKDVSFEIAYETLGKNATGKTFLLGYTDYEPRSITILSQNINNTLADLLFTNKSKDVVYKITEIESQTTDENGSFILNNIPDGNVMIYDTDRNLVSGFTVSSDGVVTGLAAEAEYYISYSLNKNMEIFYKVGKNSIPYVSIEIQNEVNLGISGKNMLIEIPKASLEIDPNLNFNANQITSIPFTFHILGGEMNIAFY